MNLFNIINEIEKVDPDFQERISPRRDAIKNITSFGSKVAVAALPFAVSTLFKKAYGAATTTTASVIDILTFALTLEYLESTFYNTAAATPGLIPSGDLTTYFDQIKTDENNHVAFLQQTIKSLGGTFPAQTSFNYDFTDGGTFPTVLSDYTIFLDVSLTFEDTGVRAYKGQAPNLMGHNAILTAALGIHAVEARHASAVRTIRGLNPWITTVSGTGNDTGVSQVDANYAGENNVTQLGLNVTTLASVESSSSTSEAVATAAFDEPLDMATVLGLVSGFISAKS
jgi:rubrerythrin